MNGDGKNRREIIISVIAILILIVAVIGVTYAVFTYTGVGTKENKISTGELSFSYYEATNGISIVNAEPIADSLGKVLAQRDEENGIQNGYFDFTISNNITGEGAIHYEIYGVDESPIENVIDSQYVKVYLTKVDTEEAVVGYDSTVPTFASLSTAESDPNGKRLYYGSFHGTGVEKFRLRIWVSSDYTVRDVSKSFVMKVNVKAVAETLQFSQGNEK